MPKLMKYALKFITSSTSWSVAVCQRHASSSGSSDIILQDYAYIKCMCLRKGNNPTKSISCSW